MPQYDGAALARSVRCVVVTANYRVGTLGFGYLAHHGGMLAEAANLGLHDAAAALAWVVANIEAFGGDAEAITLAGQSAGGFLATALAVAPGAPRVRALAAFSGAASRIVAEDVARELGDALLMELGIRETPERIIDIPVERLLLAQSRIVSTDIGERNGLRMRALGVAADAGATRPVVPAHPMEVIRGGALVHAGILASATLDEAESFRAVSAVPADRDELVAEIGRMTDEHSARRRLADAYDDADLWAARRGLLSDYIYRMPAARTVEAQHDAGGRAWLLDITRVDGTAAEHSCELRALFGRSPETPAFELRDRKIARVFHELIRSGGLSGRERGAAIVAGDPVPPERTDPSELTELWRGVARP
jgi:para-nitrobenzyl esterase